MYQKQVKELDRILDGVSANGFSGFVNTKYFDRIVLVVTVLGLASTKSFTLKALGTALEQEPDPESAISLTNQFDYQTMQDGRDTTFSIPGTTGKVFSDEAQTRILRVDSEHLNWVGVEISDWDADSALVYVTPVVATLET